MTCRIAVESGNRKKGERRNQPRCELMERSKGFESSEKMICVSETLTSFPPVSSERSRCHKQRFQGLEARLWLGLPENARAREKKERVGSGDDVEKEHTSKEETRNDLTHKEQEKSSLWLKTSEEGQNGIDGTCFNRSKIRMKFKVQCSLFSFQRLL